MNRSGPGRRAASAQKTVPSQWFAGAGSIANARRAGRADTDTFFSSAQKHDAVAGA